MPTRTMYDAIGHGYAARRHSDPRIAARLATALGGAQSLLNVGAGSGSYEPAERRVVAIEPSAVMLAQHSASLQVFEEGAQRIPLVWITDLFPPEAVPPVSALVEQGAAIMKATLERHAHGLTSTA